jgi:hypothetical protein
MNSASLMLARGASWCPARRNGTPPRQRLHQLAPQCEPFGLGARMQQRRAPRQVIEHQQRLRRDPESLRKIVPVAGDPLEAAHDVVGRDPHEAAVEGQAGLGRQGRGGGERGAQPGQQAVIQRVGPAAEVQAGAIEAHGQGIAEADERVTSQALRALHAFQQETRPERRQLHVRRNRRIQVGGDVERRVHRSSSRPCAVREEVTKNPSPAGSGDGFGA